MLAVTNMQQQNDSNVVTEENSTQDKATNENCSKWAFVELGLCILVGILPFVATNDIHKRAIPSQTTADGDLLLDLRLDQVGEEEAVSDAWLVIVAFVIPVIFQILLALAMLSSRPIVPILCTNILAHGLNLLATFWLKNYVGYLRPNFYRECVPNEVESDNGNGTYTPSFGDCTSPQEEQDEVRLSFPSGHASISFCGLVLLSVFWIHCWRGNERRWFYRWVSLLPPLLFMGVALYVAATRVHEDRHHPADVVGGALLGGSISIYVSQIWW